MPEPTALDVDHFRVRVVQDALTDALSSQWRQRAEVMEWARPRRGDHHGRATREELAARWQRLTEAAAACRHRAEIARLQTLDDELIDVIVGGGAR